MRYSYDECYLRLPKVAVQRMTSLVFTLSFSICAPVLSRRPSKWGFAEEMCYSRIPAPLIVDTQIQKTRQGNLGEGNALFPDPDSGFRAIILGFSLIIKTGKKYSNPNPLIAQVLHPSLVAFFITTTIYCKKSISMKLCSLSYISKAS